MKSFTIQQLSEQFSFEYTGNGGRLISGLAPLDEPSSSDIGYSKSARLSIDTVRSFGGLIVPSRSKAQSDTLLQQHDACSDCCFIYADDPYALLVHMIPLFFPESVSEPTIDPTAIIHSSVRLGKHVKIGRNVVIEQNCQIADGVRIDANVTMYSNVEIGKNSRIYAGVVLRENTVIGAHCVIQPNAVIGADGFGYIPDQELGLKAIPQVGRVVLGDYVEVGANSCIDKATLGSTKVGKGTKIDNLVQVGHNVKIGNYSLVCGQVGIAGSCSIGDQVVLAGQVGVADHMLITSKTRVGAQSGVFTPLTEPGDYNGYPAIPLFESKRNGVELRRISESVRAFRKDIKRIKERLFEGEKIS